MSERTPRSMQTPLGWLSDNATPKKRRDLIDRSRTGRAMADGKLNLKAVAEVLAERGLDPTVELIEIIQSKKLPVEVEAKLLTTLMEYCHPKKKSVEITGAEGGPVQVENVSDAMLMQIAMRGVAEIIEEADVVEDADVVADESAGPWPFPPHEKKALE